MTIENDRARGLDRAREFLNRLALAAFTKVWYTLNEHCRFAIADCRLIRVVHWKELIRTF